MSATIILLLLVTSCAQTYQSGGTDWEAYYANKRAEFDARKLPEDESASFPVADEITSEELKEFKKIKCNGRGGPKCAELFEEMILARLRLHYGLDGSLIYRENCTAQPKFCGQPRIMEWAFIRAHNIKVEEAKQRWFAEEKARVDSMVQSSP